MCFDCEDSGLLRREDMIGVAPGGWFRIRTLAELLDEEHRRIEALDPDEASRRATQAVFALFEQRGKEIGVKPFDPGYHGCDPIWRELYFAVTDVCSVARRSERR